VNSAETFDEELARVFANIPILRGSDPGEFSISPLPGYTNRNYRLYNRQHDWVLRLPRPRTDRFIDRGKEAHNQDLAHRLGLAPQVAWRSDDGVTLTPTLRNSRSLRRDDFGRDGILHLIVDSLRQLHRSELRFEGSDDLGELLEMHYRLLDSERRAHFAARMVRAQRILASLEDDPQHQVASHRDLVLENLLLVGERLWVIDWEYSAMASPYWDLATLCNEADLNPVQSRRLLQAYCADAPAMQESTLFDYREILNLFSDCWMAALAG
jgi:thiamine kinase-like enzyme